MGQAEATACLEQLLELAQRVEDELERPQPDLDGVARLLGERDEVFRSLQQAVGDGAGGAGDAELREMASALQATDRRVMERARALRSEALAAMGRAREQRGAADAYRRAVVRPARGSGAFLDGRV